jgi:hypothetical protein
LTSRQLTIIPEKWITKLYEGTLEANTNLVLQLVKEIPKTETRLLQSLTKLVGQFEFEQLVDLVDLVDLVEPLITHD